MTMPYDPMTSRPERQQSVLEHFQLDDGEIQNWMLPALGASYMPIFHEVFAPASRAAYRGDLTYPESHCTCGWAPSEFCDDHGDFIEGKDYSIG